MTHSSPTMLSIKLFLCVMVMITVITAEHHDGDDEDKKPCIWATLHGYKVAGIGTPSNAISNLVSLSLNCCCLGYLGNLVN